MILIINFINKILWGITSTCLLGSGIYFTKKLHFVQFNIKKMLQSFGKNAKNKKESFKVLMFTLAARIGVGSLAGIALAIYIGGPGTIFWLWISTFLVLPNAYAESYLGVLFHEKIGSFYEGGPAFYIKKGLKQKKLAKIYSLLVFISYTFGFLTIQSNTITKSFLKYSFISPLVIGIIIAIITGLIIFKGTKGIMDASSKMMPLIGIIYLFFTFYIIVQNFDHVGDVFLTILKNAFNYKSAGIGLLTPFVIGFQRGIFSNEAGIGTGAIGAATVSNNDCSGQGMLQMIGIYFTSLVLCTCTSFIILLSDYNTLLLENINGIELTQYAFSYHLGNIGEIVKVHTYYKVREDDR